MLMASPGTALEGFLSGQLDFGFTLVALVRGSVPEHARRQKLNAELIAVDVQRLTGELGACPAKNELLVRCSQLERLIAAL